MRGIALAMVGTSLVLAACLDVREFEGTWTGAAVGERAELLTGFEQGAVATLDIDHIDLHSLRAQLTIEGDVLDGAQIQPVPGAEADVLSTMTFDGGPSRVYLAFAETTDGGGPATVFVAVYYEDRVEVRVLRGGPMPLYGIFALAAE